MLVQSKLVRYASQSLIAQAFQEQGKQSLIVGTIAAAAEDPNAPGWALFANARPTVPGDQAFTIYETYGLPLDFMVDAARDQGANFDQLGFERKMHEEQERARASWKGGSQKSAAPVYRELPKTEFEGYTALRVDGARVLALVKDGLGVNALQPGETGEVVLDATSFYADSGGQVGDVGVAVWGGSRDRRSRGGGVHETGAGGVCASGDGEAGDCRGRGGRHSRERRGPRRDHAQPHRHPSAAGRAARGAGQACQAGRVVEHGGAAAL